MERNGQLKSFSQKLRREQTKEEAKLWLQFLKRYPLQFRRQYVIGNYIVDFYCAEAKLIVEIDGPQHYEDKGMEYDTERTTYLEQYDVRVLRIPNNEVNQNFSGVCEYIDLAVKQSLSQLR